MADIYILTTDILSHDGTLYNSYRHDHAYHTFEEAREVALRAFRNTIDACGEENTEDFIALIVKTSPERRRFVYKNITITIETLELDLDYQGE
jgi:hypothetical protein